MLGHREIEAGILSGIEGGGPVRGDVDGIEADAYLGGVLVELGGDARNELRERGGEFGEEFVCDGFCGVVHEVDDAPSLDFGKTKIKESEGMPKAHNAKLTDEVSGKDSNV